MSKQITQADHPLGPHVVRATRWEVARKDEPPLSEMTTHIRIDDEGAGEFVVIEQSARTDVGLVCIDADEWPLIRATIDAAIASRKK
jgi:hypothetical protein